MWGDLVFVPFTLVSGDVNQGIFFHLLWIRRQSRPIGGYLKCVLAYFEITKGLKCLMAGGFNVGRVFASQNKIILAQKELDF